MKDIRRNFHILEDILLLIFNDVIESGHVPVEWKQAIVKSFYRAGQRKDDSSYRPISSLPSLSGIFEKFLFGVINNFLNKLNIMSSNQYGFVTGRRTRSLREYFRYELYYALENNQVGCALVLDVPKALDTVNHSILLDKHFSYGFRCSFLIVE